MLITHAPWPTAREYRPCEIIVQYFLEYFIMFVYPAWHTLIHTLLLTLLSGLRSILASGGNFPGS